MDAQVENSLLNTSNDQSSGIWKLTRVMKHAGYRYKASSDGTNQDVTGNPNNDKWGGGVQVGAQTATVAFGIGAASSTKSGGRSTITGLTGMTAGSSGTPGSPGHFLKIVGATNAANNGTWLITKFISATSVQIENPAAVAETTPGTATWTELSALTDTFPGTFGVGAWWCSQGASTVRVPIGTSVPAGTFVPGENVTQATTGATGEFMGIVTDPPSTGYVGGAGYMVISPRLSGTGSGPRGWSAVDVITGGHSTATITPTATIIEYVREIVFWRGSSTQGHIYYQCIDQASEATPSVIGTGRFSTMAANGLTTALLCPGGSLASTPATNGFPLYGSCVPLGTAATGGAATSPLGWFDSNVAVNLGKCQLLVANCIEDAGISSDGSITAAAGTPITATTSYEGWGFQRVDEQEAGDLDPYVWILPQAVSGYNNTRLAANTVSSSGDVFSTVITVALSESGNGGSPALGFRRRGYASGGVLNGDSFQQFGLFLLGAGGTPFAAQVVGTPETVACAFVTTKVRDPIYVISTHLNLSFMGQQTSVKIRKGVLRWWFVVQGNAGNDTYDTKRWIQLSSTAAPVIVGPGDQTTVPVNQ